jgi:hypothetical protein
MENEILSFLLQFDKNVKKRKPTTNILYLVYI